MILISSFQTALAITGSLGNSRMVLRLAPGESVEKSVLVKNVNSEPLDIELSASGDLADNIKIKDESFTLKAGEEKKAYFTIKAVNEGTTESKINVKFTPSEGNGVGLAATIIVISGQDNGTDNSEDPNSDSNSITPQNPNNSPEEESGSGISGMLILLLFSTLVLLIAFFSLYLYSKRIKSKKVVNKFAP